MAWGSTLDPRDMRLLHLDGYCIYDRPTLYNLQTSELRLCWAICMRSASGDPQNLFRCFDISLSRVYVDGYGTMDDFGSVRMLVAMLVIV